jgi:hypothetical protein
MKLTKIALGCAMAVGAATAQASDVLMFPYVVSGGAVTTLVSVLNTDQAGAPVADYYTFNGGGIGPYNVAAGTRFLHWRYHIKTANTAAADCLENNGYFPTSPLDLTTYDVSGTRGDGGVMFNDPSVNNNWKGAGPLNQFSAITLTGERAVLFVHNAGFALAGGPGDRLRGEALIVEFDTGAAWGYRAAVKASTGAPADADFDFALPVGPVGPANAPFSLLPMEEVTTRFFITPVNDPDPAIAPNNTLSILLANGLDTPWFGRLRTRVDLGALTGSIRVLDRDEGGISGGVTPQTVTCVWPVDADDLITAANILNYTNPQGGFARLVTARPAVAAADLAAGFRPTQNAVVIKLEFRPAGAGGQFNMPAGVGAFNNSFQLNP